MSKSTKKPFRYWKNKLDPEFSKLIRQKGRCERCGSTNTLQCAHVITRVNKILRWDILNALCLCFRCHKFFWHDNPLEATQWFQLNFPERYKYLMEVKNTIIQRTDEDYKLLLEDIKDRNFQKLIIHLTN